MIVRWPINDEAPFAFQFNKKIEVLEKADLTSQTLSEFNPDLIYISGWVDKQYKKIALDFKKQSIPVLMGIDNPWKGSFRQRMAAFLSPAIIKPYYSHVWCPGERQYEFARRIGFSEEKILTGFYSADVPFFHNNNQEPLSRPKILLYAGRFLEWKGIMELYQSFFELKEETGNDWKLLMYGRGPLEKALKPTKDIEINDFIQPDELKNIMQNVGAFCLPSYEEHWGVVVHEAAASGCPILVSEGVGAGTAFVRNGYNGFVFKSKSKVALKEGLRKMIACSESERQLMGERSVELANRITPEIWSATLLSLLK